MHPDIRNEDAAGILNEMTRKRKSNPTTQQGPPQSQVDASGNWNIRDSTDAGEGIALLGEVAVSTQVVGGGSS